MSQICYLVQKIILLYPSKPFIQIKIDKMLLPSWAVLSPKLYLSHDGKQYLTDSAQFSGHVASLLETELYPISFSSADGSRIFNLENGKKGIFGHCPSFQQYQNLSKFDLESRKMMERYKWIFLIMCYPFQMGYMDRINCARIKFFSAE